MIRMMKERVPPIVPRRGQPPKANVVACAIAMYRGERFESDSTALELFGVAPRTDVRAVWVDGKLAEFAPAGLGIPGEPALPVYLLDRCEAATAQQQQQQQQEQEQQQQSEPEKSSSGSEHSSDEEDDDLRRDERRQERREQRFLQRERDGERAEHEREEREAPARRAREAAEWDAAHGTERDEAWTQLMHEQPDVYWALMYSFGGPLKWVLRAGECLESDITAIISEQEALQLYRGFRPFRSDGSVSKALKVLAGSSQMSSSEWMQLLDWCDRERAIFDPQVAAMLSHRVRQPPSSPSQCVECGKAECTCPHPDDPVRADPYAVEHGGSADCHYLSATDHERLERRERYDCLAQQLIAKSRSGPLRLQPLQRSDTSDCYELDQERMIEEHGRVSSIHGKPWHLVPPGATLPAHWLDSTQSGGAVDRPWERAERERVERDDREQRERLERMARANVPPPLRAEERYGLIASNQEGDERFRKDRAVWYEHVTGEPLDGLSLTEQWERVDSIARRFREYTDGRKPRMREAMPDTPPKLPPPQEPPLPPPPPQPLLAPPLDTPQPAPLPTARRPPRWKLELQALSDRELIERGALLQGAIDELRAVLPDRADAERLSDSRLPTEDLLRLSSSNRST